MNAYVSNQQSNTIAVVDLSSDTITSTIPILSAGLNGITISPNGKTLFVCGQVANRLYFIDIASQSVSPLPVGSAPVAVSVDAFGNSYVANKGSNTVSVSVSQQIPVGAQPTGLCLVGNRLYVANHGSGTVSMLCTCCDTLLGTWTAGNGATGLCASANGMWLYVANQYANTVSVFGIPSGSLVATISGFTAPVSVAATPDGKLLFVVNANKSTVSVVDLSTNLIEATIPVQSLPNCVAISPDGSTACVTNGYGYSLSVIDVPTLKVKSTIAKVGIYPISVVIGA